MSRHKEAEIDFDNNVSSMKNLHQLHNNVLKATSGNVLLIRFEKLVERDWKAVW